MLPFFNLQKILSFALSKLIFSRTAIFCIIKKENLSSKDLRVKSKKGEIKVYAMMDAFSEVTEFVCMTEAREHDRKYRCLNLSKTHIMHEGKHTTPTLLLQHKKEEVSP